MNLGTTIGISRSSDELTVIHELLQLDGKDILELGCGRAELTRMLATEDRNRSILALEVDRVQHTRNLEITDLPNVRFELGAAENIPAADASIDVAFLFKSLHHVPIHSMDLAMRELARVLRPGAYAYISEPVFRGPLNEVLRIFHDESHVRHEAFQTIGRALDSGLLELDRGVFFNAPRSFQNFGEFQRLVIGATHSTHELSIEQLSRVRETFERYASESGGRFEQPIRVDLLRRLS